MGITGTDLDTLYLRYGFKVERADNDLRVYVLRQGYLLGADIVPLSSSAVWSGVKEDYERGGYATNLRRYDTIEDAADSLFQGFFASDQTAEHLRAYYADFAQRRTKVLGYDYEYIPCPFSINGVPQTDSHKLIGTIEDALDSPEPQLVIIEAAAGFGKTCAAYELLSRLTRPEKLRNPIFAELSRNRQARVFRYVLLDEIDRRYPNLSSAVVEHEIKQGRIPLVVDGFDELLSKRASLPSLEQNTPGADFDNVEAMLDTIGELLVQRSKIVLTTRRTAIFAGEEFQRWVTSCPNPFNVIRIGLNEPSVADWIGQERLSALEKRGIPISAIGNPVLLGFLRQMPIMEFSECCNDPDLLTTQYFRRLLDREQTRQSLRIDVDSQLKVFHQLAQTMAKSDVTAEPRSELSQHIIDGNRSILEAARATYSSAERPTIEELADKLAGHALLDRAGPTNDMIGFVNDFVFGTLIGENVVCGTEEDWFESERMFNLAVTAFRTRNEGRKFALWKRLKFESDVLDPCSQLNFDMDLCGGERRSITGATLIDLKIGKAVLGDCGTFSESTFVQCTFTEVEFVWTAFSAVGFVNCAFYNCASRGRPPDTVWNRGCREKGCDVLSTMEPPDNRAPSELDGAEKAENTIEILRQFWPVARPKPNTCLPLNSLLLGVPAKKRASLGASITLLEWKGLVKVQNELVLLNENRLGEIESILKRQG